MAKPKYLSSIVALRKAYPRQKLGVREKGILDAPGAKVSKTRDSCYKVTAKNKYFTFTYNVSGYPNFTVMS